jgi:hypothetical protein
MGRLMIETPDRQIAAQGHSSDLSKGTADNVTPTKTVSDTQRNGSIAGIAILLGFSLSFTAAWSQGDAPWAYRGLLVLAIVAAGIVMQLQALFRVLGLPVLSLDEHKLAIALFFKGVAVVLLGYVVHILLDVAFDLGLLPLN